MPTTAEKDANKQSEKLQIKVKGTVVKQSGVRLQCLYNTIKAGLLECHHPSAPAFSTVSAIRAELSAFLRGPLAPLLRLNADETLIEALAGDGSTLADAADDVTHDGESKASEVLRL